MNSTTPVPAWREPPRWAVIAAHAIPILALPSGIWRIVLGLGVPVGFSGELAEVYAAPGWITPYVFALTVLVEALALLSLGLVRPWGEVAPRWLPWIGGRVLPTWLVTATATLGALALGVLGISTALLWNGPENMGDPDAPQGVAGLVMTACYAPQLAWPPLLLALAISYALRRRGQRLPTPAMRLPAVRQ
jgi:hypothetical protein